MGLDFKCSFNKDFIMWDKLQRGFTVENIF